MISEAIDYFTKNKEWIFSGIGIFFISVGIGVPIGAVKLYCWLSDKRQERIKKFVDEFKKLCHGAAGRKLLHLIPAGINNLKSNREIKKGFKNLILTIPGHPLRTNKDRVEKIGYKKFFRYVAEVGDPLNKTSIVVFLNELEKKKGLKSKFKSYFKSLSRGK